MIIEKPSIHAGWKLTSLRILSPACMPVPPLRRPAKSDTVSSRAYFPLTSREKFPEVGVRRDFQQDPNQSVSKRNAGAPPPSPRSFIGHRGAREMMEEEKGGRRGGFLLPAFPSLPSCYPSAGRSPALPTCVLQDIFGPVTACRRAGEAGHLVSFPVFPWGGKRETRRGASRRCDV
jgi:hypothetical protein